MRLSKEIKDQVRRVAEAKDWTISEVHRRALEEYCERELTAAQASRWDRYIGCAESIEGAPENLSARATELFGQLLDEKHGRHSR